MSKTPRVLNRRTDHIGRDAVLVDRTTKWGNPFRGDRETAVRRYRLWIVDQHELLEQAREELTGKDLACWCAPEPCHAEVLLDIITASLER